MNHINHKENKRVSMGFTEKRIIDKQYKDKIKIR